jgi:hypothetical protein
MPGSDHRLAARFLGDMGKDGAKPFREAACSDADPLHGVEGGVIVFERRAPPFGRAGGFGVDGETCGHEAGERNAKK